MIHFREPSQVGGRIFSEAQQILGRSDHRAVRRNEERNSKNLFDASRCQLVDALLNGALRGHAKSDFYRHFFVDFISKLQHLAIPTLATTMREQKDTRARFRFVST